MLIIFFFPQTNSHLPLALSNTRIHGVMGENYSICIIGAMDRLWFQKIVLFSEPTSLLLPPQALKRPLPISESLPYQSSIMSIPEDELFSLASPITPTPQDELFSLPYQKMILPGVYKDDSDSEKDIRQQRRRPARISGSINSKFGSHSSLSSPQNHSAYLKNSGSVMRLQKSMSCKTLSELEVEEVKGFIDLGFKFNKSNLSPRMMSVLPGLQRLGCHESKQKDAVKADADEVLKDDEIEEKDEEKKSGVLRPYLSEAWLINRPDSPLLNLRIPRVSAAADMKKHLKCWARTVASVIHQES